MQRSIPNEHRDRLGGPTVNNRLQQPAQPWSVSFPTVKILFAIGVEFPVPAVALVAVITILTPLFISPELQILEGRPFLTPPLLYY